MTLGEKIRNARKICGFSQGQLADKMSVSRSAIAKWETDKGLPDVGNLKVLARLLNVSVDDLLDEAESTDPVLRESYDLAAYGYGCSKVKKDRVVRDKFPDAAIYPLLGQQSLGNLQQLTDTAPDCKTDPLDRIRKKDSAFYLVEKEDRQLFVTVTDTFLEIRPLEEVLTESRFHIDGWDFIKCNYEIEA